MAEPEVGVPAKRVNGRMWQSGESGNPNGRPGVPIEFKGKRFRGEFGTKSGELSEREVAGILTKEFRLELKRELRRSSHPPVTFFSGPISYPRGF